MRLLRVAVNAEQLLYRSPGGIGRYTTQLLTVMPRLFSDVEMVPFTALHRRRDVDRALRAAGCETASRLLPLPRPALYDSWHLLGAPGLPSRWGAELVHAPSVAVPPRSKIPLVVTVHDAAPELFPGAFTTRGRSFHRRGLAAAARRADVVLTVSHAAAEEIVANSRIPPERIRVVHNGVAPPLVDDSRREQILSTMGLLEQPYVFWVGSLEPRKGVDTLVSAAAQLRRQRDAPRFQLVLAGYEGWLGPEVGGEGVIQVGRVTDEQLWALYAGATLFAFPSIHEGFGLPVVEAMSQGAPVVASDIPALREVTAGAARLVAPMSTDDWAQALADLLESETERDALAASGRARSAELSVDAMISGIRAVYRELTGN
jgi:glycosyltransferase involved in cell wall biosynthesis